ncbi:MAG: FtsX-like permease family protein [Ruminococcaceae bacterium]|nr:FtsX-like permease family protein [Oscillospiraceae bacterium]
MNLKQSFVLALKSLASSKMRAILTMLGIIIGVAAVIIIVSMVNGVTGDVVAQFEKMGATTINVNVMGRGGNRSVSVDDMQDLVDDNPQYLKSMTPVITIPGTTVKNGSANVEPTTLAGVNEYYTEIKSKEIMLGRGLQYADSEYRLRNCVIGTYIAKELFGTTQVLGESIKINGIDFSVVGVFEETADGKEATEDDIIIVPHTMSQKISSGFSMGTYTFNAVSKEVSDKAQALIEAYLLEVFSSENAYRVSNMSEMIESVNDVTSTMSLMLAGIAAVSLLVGGIGIMNIMLVSVTERTREIGIRKSLGATPWDIMSQFVVEAITTSCLGGVIGIIIGVVGSYGASALMDLKAAISVGAIIISFTVSALIGIAFGYFPAKKASRLNPIDALRYD